MLKSPQPINTRTFVCLIFFLLTGSYLHAQQFQDTAHSHSKDTVHASQTVALHSPVPPFWGEIAAFKKQDSIRKPPAGAILFVGSSTFRKWTSLSADFPGYTLINRGFGGSTLPDVIRYAKDIIFPYHPKQIFIYCGDNDLAVSDSVSAQVVFRRWVQLYELIRSHLDKVDIMFVSIKPSPSRERLMRRMEEANDLIRDFMAKYNHATFIDVYHRMLTPQGHADESLFIEDKLHMNAKGYALWQQLLQPYLEK